MKKFAFLLMLLLFVVNCNAEDKAESLDSLIKKVQENPKDYKAIDELARLASKTRRVDFVKPVFIEYINSKDNTFTGYMGRALLNFMGSDQDMGLKDSMRAIEIAKQKNITVPAELYFHMADLDAAIARLKEAGARELSALSPRPWGDEAAYYADPDGNVLAVARPVPDVAGS